MFWITYKVIGIKSFITIAYKALAAAIFGNYKQVSQLKSLSLFEATVVSENTPSAGNKETVTLLTINAFLCSWMGISNTCAWLESHRSVCASPAPAWIA